MTQNDKARVLMVDDEEQVLVGFRRNLRTHYDIMTAVGPGEGVKAVQQDGPFAVIVADYQMPEINGIAFLAKTRKIAPDSIRMMLTGNANLDMAIESVNAGHIFRFMTKPCKPETLVQVIDAGVAQYQLQRAEKELLEKTLKGCVKILTDVLSLTNPAAYGRASRLHRIAGQLGRIMNAPAVWKIEIAAMLSQAGCVTIPDETLGKYFKGEPVSEGETEMVKNHPSVGASLIENIPRLSDVAEIVKYQSKYFDGSGLPDDEISGENLPIGARILRVALDYDSKILKGVNGHRAIDELARDNGKYDPGVIAAVRGWLKEERAESIVWRNIEELKPGMIIVDNVCNAHGVVLVPRGHEVTTSMKMKLKNFSLYNSVIQPIKVYDVPQMSS